MCSLALIHAVCFYLDGLFILLPLVQQCSILLYISIIMSPLILLQFKTCLMQQKERLKQRLSPRRSLLFSQQKAHFHFEFPERSVSLLSPYKCWCFQCFSGGSGDSVTSVEVKGRRVVSSQTSQPSVLICCRFAHKSLDDVTPALWLAW